MMVDFIRHRMRNLFQAHSNSGPHLRERKVHVNWRGWGWGGHVDHLIQAEKLSGLRKGKQGSKPEEQGLKFKPAGHSGSWL